MTPSRWFSPLSALLLGAALGCGNASNPTAPDPDSGAAPGAVDLAPLPAGDYLVVLNRQSRDVSILSGARGYSEVRRLDLPALGGPSGLAVDPGTGTIYVGFPDSTTTVVALGLDGVERARTLVTGWSPDLALDAGRNLLAVAMGSGVEFLDAASLQSHARLRTGVGRTGAWDVTLDPDAGVAVVSNTLDDQLAIVSSTDFTLLARTAVDAFPQGVAIVSGVAYVAAGDADLLDAVSLADGRLLSTTPTGNGPTSVVADPVRGRVYVANDLSGEVSVVDASSGAEVARWALHHALPNLALSGDGALLFVSHSGAARVEIYDALTGVRIGDASVGSAPSALEAVTLR
jgi:DNA-binding beta-propeller fold protein YncE